MSKIFYTVTNKSKVIFYLMILALGILRLTIIFEIKFFHLEGYEVYIIPTLLYYFVLFAVVTGLFFGYKFFFTEYNETRVIYHNLLLNRSRSIDMKNISHARFERRGIRLYGENSDKNSFGKKTKNEFFIPFFRFGIIEAISVNSFFEALVENQNISVEKTFRILPGYSKAWTAISLIYAVLSFCLLIICMEPLYTAIVLFQTFM